MQQIVIPQEGFFVPTFEDISFFASPLAMHPTYTLKMFSQSPPFDIYQDPQETAYRYAWELFEKLTEIETYEYHFLMTYHIEDVVDKRKWINSFMLLIQNNKELFIRCRGIEKYTFLFEMATKHYSAFNNAFMSSLADSCDDCRSRIMSNLKHDVDLIRHLDKYEREYFIARLNMDYRRFSKFWNFNPGSIDLNEFTDQDKMLDATQKMEEGLNEAFVKMGFKDLSGLKQIEANCTTGDCAKYVADFLMNTKDEDGAYVFEYNNSNLSEWMPRVFHCKKSKVITASSYRDKLPSKSKNRRIRRKPGSRF